MEGLHTRNGISLIITIMSISNNVQTIDARTYTSTLQLQGTGLFYARGGAILTFVKFMLPTIGHDRWSKSVKKDN